MGGENRHMVEGSFVSHLWRGDAVLRVSSGKLEASYKTVYSQGSYFYHLILLLTCEQSTLFTITFCMKLSFYEIEPFSTNDRADVNHMIEIESLNRIVFWKDPSRFFFFVLTFKKNSFFWSIIHSWLVAIRYDGYTTVLWMAAIDKK